MSWCMQVFPFVLRAISLAETKMAFAAVWSSLLGTWYASCGVQPARGQAPHSTGSQSQSSDLRLNPEGFLGPGGQNLRSLGIRDQPLPEGRGDGEAESGWISG